MKTPQPVAVSLGGPSDPLAASALCTGEARRSIRARQPSIAANLAAFAGSGDRRGTSAAGARKRQPSGNVDETGHTRALYVTYVLMLWTSVRRRWQAAGP